MVKFYISKGQELTEIPEAKENCWIHLEAPTHGEIAEIVKLTGVDEEHLLSVLDEDEVAHIVVQEEVKAVIIDIPKIVGDEIVQTLPLALITTDKYLISVTNAGAAVLGDFFSGKFKDVDTAKRTMVVCQILLHNSRMFLHYLRTIDKESGFRRGKRLRSMENKEILEQLDAQKSLVFFSASLNGNFAVIQKLANHADSLSEEERDIIEDTLLDSKQAIEMCYVCREIIKSTMDAFASVVNNNQNKIMKFLAAVTIILSIPMLIASFWGMNTAVPFQGTFWGFLVVLAASAIVTGIAAVIMIKKRMF